LHIEAHIERECASVGTAHHSQPDELGVLSLPPVFGDTGGRLLKQRCN